MKAQWTKDFTTNFIGLIISIKVYPKNKWEAI